MANELTAFQKAKVMVQTYALPIVGVLVVFLGYCLFKMKKRNVKIFGR